MSEELTKEIIQLARLFVPDKSKRRKNLYVRYMGASWHIRSERDKKSIASYDSQKAAIDNAKLKLKLKNATAVIIYNQRGRIQEIIQ